MSLSSVSSKLTEETLNEIIKSAGGIVLTSWKFNGEFKKEVLYQSEVTKLTLNGVNDTNEEITVQLVIKSMPKCFGRRKTFRSSDFFRNEINFYNIIIKGFNEFQDNRKVFQTFVEVAKCFVAYTDGENDYVALDDLTQYGYDVPTRQNGMDIHLSRLIMATLGRFHGMSFVIRDQSPELFEKLSNGLEETYYSARLKPWYKDFMNNLIDIASDAVTKEYRGSVVENKMKNFFHNGDCFDKMVNLTHNRNQYCVIGHGDCWTPNFLVNYVEMNGKQIPVKAKMIDFQLSRFASPAIDISCFIYSCTTEEFRNLYYDDLINTYYTGLKELIIDFGSNPETLFPFKALENELKTCARFGVGMGIESIPFTILEDSETPDLDLIEGDEAIPIEYIWILKKIESPEGRKRLADVFKHACDRGYLN